MGHHKNCVACGNRYTAERVTRRYCSDACRLKFHRAVWNDITGGKLSLLLRQVADTVDGGQAARSQFIRLRSLLSEYERHLLVTDCERYYAPKKRRSTKSA